MRGTTAFFVAALTLATVRPGLSVRPVEPALRLADMGMGDLGPQLGGSSDDMMLSDPGHLPSEPNMMLSDPGHVPSESNMMLDDPGHVPREPNMMLDDPGRVPREPNMMLEQPQDLDRSDDID